jgi:hypothetical protein
MGAADRGAHLSHVLRPRRIGIQTLEWRAIDSENGVVSIERVHSHGLIAERGRVRDSGCGAVARRDHGAIGACLLPSGTVTLTRCTALFA